MAHYFIGIDPGNGGAIGIVSGLKNAKAVVHDMPTRDAPTKSKTKRKECDAAALADILRPYVGKEVHIVLENVHAMTGQGVTSMFNFGESKGFCRGVIESLFGNNYELATPATWKKAYDDRLKANKVKDSDGTKSKKEIRKLKAQAKKEAKAEARVLAAEIFPEVEDQLQRAKDDGRAEALLIAEYKRRQFVNG